MIRRTRRTTFVEEIDDGGTSTGLLEERTRSSVPETADLETRDGTGAALESERTGSELGTPVVASGAHKGRTGADLVAELLSNERNIVIGLYALATLVTAGQIKGTGDLIYPFLVGTFFILLWKLWPLVQRGLDRIAK